MARSEVKEVIRQLRTDLTRINDESKRGVRRTNKMRVKMLRKAQKLIKVI